jgi:hypothetical protein
MLISQMRDSFEMSDDWRDLVICKHEKRGCMLHPLAGVSDHFAQSANHPVWPGD